MLRVKVMPSEAGIPGYDALGNRIAMRPGFPAYVDADDVELLEAEGRVQRLAGRSSRELKIPKVSEPENLDAVLDEDPPVAKPRAKSRQRTYKRRDLQAERPKKTG